MTTLLNATHLNVTKRRDFLKISLAGGALMLSFPHIGFADGDKARLPDDFRGTLGVFIRINPDNSVIIGAPVPDMGQGTYTSIPMIIADELDVAWDSVTVEKLRPLLAKRESGDGYGEGDLLQSAGGSASIRLSWKGVRQAGAMARQTLKIAGAQRMKVSVDEVTTKEGFVYHNVSGQKISYGELVEVAATLTPPKEFNLKSPAEFTIIGREQKNTAVEKIITGQPTYGPDMKIPGMKHAVIARCPYLDGGVKSFDASKALKVKGVRQVVDMDRYPEDFGKNKVTAAGVAVIADSLWAALKGRDALEIEWSKGPNAHLDSEWVEQQFDDLMQGSDKEVQLEIGKFDAAYEGAVTKLEADYDCPYWAHINMEPQNCIVDVRDDGVTVIIGHQAPAVVVNTVARLTGFEAEKIDVHILRMGTGLGRKFRGDSTLEATRLSQKLKVPIKLFWSREDDVENDFFNPKTRHRFKGGLDKDGNIVALNYLLGTTAGSMAVHNFPAHYVPNFRADMVKVKGLATGAWRGPRHNIAGFAIQSFMDEMAHAAGKDPLEYRLDLLNGRGKTDFADFGATSLDSDRIMGVLKLAAEKAGWGRKLPKGHGMGIANYFTFGGYAAFVVEVKVEKGVLHIIKAVGAVDCGIAVNPLGVKAQVEGGAMDGFSAALGQDVIFKEGRVLSHNLDSYSMARMGDLPQHVEAHIVSSNEDPTGTGEIALPAAIPALCNAIYAACGKRIRRFPIGDQLKDA